MSLPKFVRPRPSAACLPLPRCCFEQKRDGKTNGRFVFVPKDREKNAGYLSGVTLKNPDGSYMNRDQAIMAVNAIHAAIDGKSVAASYSPMVPQALTMQALCDDYRSTAAWQMLTPGTRSNYNVNITRILKDNAFGGMIVGDIEANHINDILTALAHNKVYTIHAVNQIKGMLVRLFKRGLGDRKRWGLTYNPAREANPIRDENGGKRGRKNPWTVEQIVAVIATLEHLGHESLVDAVIIALATGCNPVDIINLPRLESEDGIFKLPPRIKTVRRTGAFPLVPSVPFFVERLRVMNRRNDEAGYPKTHQLINTLTGRPYDYIKEVTQPVHLVMRLVAGDLAGFNALNRKYYWLKLHDGDIASLDTLPVDVQPSLLLGRYKKEFRDLRSTAINAYTRVAGREIAEYIACHAEGGVASNDLSKQFYLEEEAMRAMIKASPAATAYPELNKLLTREPLRVVAG